MAWRASSEQSACLSASAARRPRRSWLKRQVLGGNLHAARPPPPASTSRRPPAIRLSERRGVFGRNRSSQHLGNQHSKRRQRRGAWDSYHTARRGWTPLLARSESARPCLAPPLQATTTKKRHDVYPTPEPLTLVAPRPPASTSKTMRIPTPPHVSAAPLHISSAAQPPQPASPPSQ